MSQGNVFGVLLTDQAWLELGQALEPYASEGSIGRYIYCEEIQLGGQYFVMVASSTNPDGSSFKAEIGIPHHHVKMYIAANEHSQIGFIHKYRINGVRLP
jgi:hypothetical protein